MKATTSFTGTIVYIKDINGSSGLNKVFTIVQTAKKGTWEKLKSGAGRISLSKKYVQIL